MISRSFAPIISDRSFFSLRKRRRMTQIITFKGCRCFVGRRSQKIEPEPEPKPGWVRRSLCGVEVWRRLENPCQIDLNQKQKCKTHNLTISITQWGSPTCFLPNERTKWDFEISWFQVFTLPIYSFMGHLNQILATSSKGKLLVRTKVFGDHVNFGETKGEDYTILYIYWLVGSTHLPNWRHSNYWSQIKQICQIQVT